ncbi:MAG: chemotaxis response regulator protein-glutamate methylesterase [Pseudomonadota bacterium]
MPRPARVLIVDDSALVREALSEIIAASPNLSVMGTASDPLHAARLIRDELPDVITLDIEMPRMDGITFLRRLMAQRPMPVVVCSSLVGDGSATLDAALEAGAVDIIAKPQLGQRRFFEESAIRIQDAVLAAAQARTEHLGAARTMHGRHEKVLELVGVPAASRTASASAMLETTDRVVAIGASTGGTEALRVVLEALPADAPPLLIVQHMPAHFTGAFAQRLDRLARMHVREAADGDRALRGTALIAPGNRHMMAVRSGATYRVQLGDGDLVNRHRPSADVMFRSVARHAGANAVGIIMTGMGSDGADGLLNMREAGARCFGQNEQSCVVYGMPAAAMRAGAVEAELTPEGIAEAILRAGNAAAHR